MVCVKTLPLHGDDVWASVKNKEAVRRRVITGHRTTRQFTFLVQALLLPHRFQLYYSLVRSDTIRNPRFMKRNQVKGVLSSSASGRKELAYHYNGSRVCLAIHLTCDWQYEVLL
jgi:hypothetical protein